MITPPDDRCPCCKQPVSPWSDYLFVPSQDKRWHPYCYKLKHPNTSAEDVK